MNRRRETRVLGFRNPVLAGRIGGLVRSATHDGQTVTQKARGTFAASFLDGHSCAVCPSVEIPPELAAPERERRAAALKKLHYTRIASLPRVKKAAPNAIGTALEVERASAHTTAS
jgi:hypothetical protein